MHDLIFGQQALLEPAILPVWAGELGLDLEKYKAAIGDVSIAKRIKEDRTSGIHSGVNGTPSFFINGKRHNQAPDYNSLRAALNAELETI